MILKHNRKILVGVLTAVLSIFMVGLSACQPKAQPATETSVAPTTAAVAVLPTLQVTPQATAAPVVLAGATTTQDGLQYLEEVAGTGPAPQVGDVIVMNYTVTLPDGTLIYSTYSANSPATAVWGKNQLLPGWEEGIGMMKAGGKAKFVLPPELALGSQGSGNIPPNSQLIMEVELLSVEPAPDPYSVALDQYQTLADGLQYYDITIGDGAEAISNTTVTTSYTIWVKGETSNDFVISSDSGQPVTFVVGNGNTVFPGWEEGVIGMRVGGERQLIIPPQLALGSQASGPIPANATLILEISLTNVAEPKKPLDLAPSDYTTMPSGLKYYDIKVGTGITPTIGQTVVVNYVGWLEDGTQFDSSYDRGQTFSFKLGTGNVILGWDLGLSSMKVGGIRQLLIPPDLAYGSQGSGSTIPPNATLIFQVELLEIK